MKVFISWSGEASLKFAEFLRGWLPNVIQATEPFFSNEDVRKGVHWISEIGERLEQTDFGILCITPENQTKPWLLFEAGALAKKVKRSNVCPLLLGMNQADLLLPLSQFQATVALKDDVYKLIKSMNAALKNPLEEARLRTVFEKFWGEFEDQVKKTEQQLKLATGKEQGESVTRALPEMVEELLNLTRGIVRRLDESAEPKLEEMLFGPSSASHATTITDLIELYRRSRDKKMPGGLLFGDISNQEEKPGPL